MNDSKPSSQRPEHPDFWDQRFSQGVTPWDSGLVPLDLQAFCRQQPQALATLIPGCGSAYEAAYFARLGWPVCALDFSPQAVARAQAVLGENWGGSLHCADFFSHYPEPGPQLIYERAFLCALPRRLWADWGRRLAELLPAGGLLAGYFFIAPQLKGPPFGIDASELRQLLADFDCLEDRPSQDPLPVFAAGERWMLWRRR